MTTERLINEIIESLEAPITPHTTITKVIKVLEFLRDEPYELMGLTEAGISDVIHRLLE